jgi:PST family polysaccharide transporter
MINLKKKTITGILWGVFSRVGTEIIALVVSVILARLLTPEDYGLLGMVTIFVGFSNVFIRFSFGPAIVYKKGITEIDLSSIFWMNLLLGFFFAVLLVLFSKTIAQFFNEPKLVYICIILSSNFVIGAFNVVQLSILEKKMEYKTLAKIKVYSSVSAGVIALTMAHNGFSYWSLVAHSILLILVQGIFLWLQSSWKPAFIFEKKSIASISKFSMNLLGERALGYFTETFDKGLVGKLAGSEELGLYNKGWGGVLFPLKSVALVVSNVIFSSISSIQDDKPRVGRLFVKAVNVVSFIIMPLMLGAVFLTEELVLFVFGEQWVGMIPYMKIFGLVGIVSSIFTLTQSVFTGLGRTDILFKISLIEKPLSIISVIIGYYLAQGQGAAFSLLFAMTVSLVLRQYWIFKLTTISLFEQYKTLGIILIPNITMISILMLVKYCMPNATHFVYLSVSFVMGVITYLLISMLLKISVLIEMKNYALKQLGR